MVHPVKYDYAGKNTDWDFNLFPPDLARIRRKGCQKKNSAYSITFNTDKTIKNILGSCTCTFDCDGDPLLVVECELSLKDFPYLWPALWWTYPHYGVDYYWNDTPRPGVFVDNRTFEQIMGGCCPKWGFLL